MSRSPPASADEPGAARQRVDKYLWFARMARTRSAAAQLVSGGHVRVNGRKIEQPGRAVGPGDVLTVSLERAVRVLRIVALAERRGPFQEARLLYEDLTEGAGDEPPSA